MAASYFCLDLLLKIYAFFCYLYYYDAMNCFLISHGYINSEATAYFKSVSKIRNLTLFFLD